MKKQKFKLVILIVVLGLLAIAYYSFSYFNNQPTVTISGHVFEVDVATDPDDIETGLSGRKDLADDQAMLFIFPRKQELAFWMHGMNFNIDLLWIDGNKVLDYEKNMPAPNKNTAIRDLPRFFPSQPVDKVLEMKAGLIDSLGIKIGDTVDINID